MTSDDHLHETVRICHKKGRVVGVNDQSYSVEIELGGVDQEILVAEHVVEDQAEDR